MDNLYTKRFEATDSRLGRHVRHDPRSKQYAYKAAHYFSKKHTSFVPTFDQGELGSCTGNASSKKLSYFPFWGDAIKAVLGDDASLDEQYAIGVYSAATKIDDYDGSYPPEDTGSDGLSVAKVLKSRGLISGYQHAFDMDALLSALSVQPVIVGTAWHNDMFDPASDGQLSVTGDVAGGHEYVLDEIDVENQRVWMQNSWGDSWGQNGRAWFSWDDFKALLADDGDCTIFTPLTVAPPSPATPAQAFEAAAAKWLKVKHRTDNNKAFEKALKDYLATL